MVPHGVPLRFRPSSVRIAPASMAKQRAHSGRDPTSGEAPSHRDRAAQGELGTSGAQLFGLTETPALSLKDLAAWTRTNARGPKLRLCRGQPSCRPGAGFARPRRARFAAPVGAPLTRNGKTILQRAPACLRSKSRRSSIASGLTSKRASPIPRGSGKV